MNRPTLFLLTLCAAVVTSSGSLRAADDPKPDDSPVGRVLAKIPAENAAELNELSARLVDLGPEAVAAVCARLVPPGTGDDTAARYALEGLSTYVHRPGAERERLIVVGTYIKALESAGSDEVRAFLIRQLERVGREEALATLAEYVGDPRLGEPAVRALVTIARIGTPGVPERLLRALPYVEEGRKVTIINGLGTLKVEAAAEALLPYAGSESAAIRQATLAAVARIGDPSAERLLAEAANSENDTARRHGSALYLLYAKRQAESGRAESCVRICRDLIAARKAPRETNIACAALSTLVGAVGAEASGDVLAAMKSEYADVRGVACRLALSIPGTDFTRQCVDVMQAWTPEARAAIIDMLGRRGDQAALAPIREALAASLREIASDVQFAAIQAIARLTERPALTVLLDEMSRDGLAKYGLVGFLERFGGEQALRAVVEGTKSDDELVRGASLGALIRWPEPNALEPLLAEFRVADDRRPRAAILDAYLRLVAASGRSQDDVLALYKDGLAASRSTEEKKKILGGLGRLKFRPSLELVQTFFKDDDLKEDAAAAAVSIIKPRRSGRGGLRGRRVMATLETVIELTGRDEVRTEARDILKDLKDSDERRR